jgi:hypothetical protein
MEKMRMVFYVLPENISKAEMALKRDDEISRQSIHVRSAQSLDMDEEGFFIILNGSERILKRAKELIKDFATEYENSDIVLQKFDEQEEKASEGFGFILGE